MYFNFTSTVSEPKESLFLKDQTNVTAKFEISNYIGVGSSGGYGSTLTYASTLADSYSDIIVFTRVVSSKVAYGRYQLESMGALVNISDESTFQLSLENIHPDSFIHYNDIYNQYGFGSTQLKAEGAARHRNGVLVGNAVGMIQSSDFFNWELPQEEVSDEYSYTLYSMSPFFGKFHNEMIPFIKRNIVNDFIHLGQYFYDEHFTKEDLINDTVYRKCVLPYNIIQIMMKHYMEGTKYLFEYQKYYPKAFEGYRKIFGMYFFSHK